MDYIEIAKEEIKKEWFNNHTVELHGKEGLQVLRFREKGTNAYALKYILSGNDLVVTGDLGEAVYSLTCAATVENLKKFNLSYLMKKMTAYSGERWSFDEGKAMKELEEWYEEKKYSNAEGLEDIYSTLRAEVNNWSMQEHFQTAVFSIYDKADAYWFDGEEASMIADFGKQLPYQFIAFWLGLQMAIEQLESKAEKSA